MKKLVSALVFTLGSTIAVSAIAAPSYEHRYDERHYAEQHDHDWKKQDGRWNDQRYQRINPSRDWRVGQTLPRGYDSSRYAVDYRDAKRLHKPARYQQWYKINGDYVLVNERNNRIIRILN